MPIFDERKLLVTTFVIAFLCFSFILFKGDDGVIIYYLAGFFYTLILWSCLTQKIARGRLLLGGVILSVANVFSLFSAAPFGLLPREILRGVPYISEYLFYIFPSLTGAWITLLVLKYVWKLNINKQHWLVVSVFMLVVPLVTSIILNNLGDKNYIQDDLKVSLNSLFWWLGFSISILLVQRNPYKWI